jgi:hypothetical protein
VLLSPWLLLLNHRGLFKHPCLLPDHQFLGLCLVKVGVYEGGEQKWRTSSISPLPGPFTFVAITNPLSPAMYLVCHTSLLN